MVFSASVVNVSIDDFLLTSTGTAAGTIVGVTPSAGTSFTVTVGSIVGDGTLRLDLKNGTDIHDAMGNTASGYTAGSTVSIDNTAPTASIAAVTPNPRVTPGRFDRNPIQRAGCRLRSRGPAIHAGRRQRAIERGDAHHERSAKLDSRQPFGHRPLLSATTNLRWRRRVGHHRPGRKRIDGRRQRRLADQAALARRLQLATERWTSLDCDILLANIGMRSGATFEMGDANHDGAINILDLNIWKANSGREPRLTARLRQ